MFRTYDDYCGGTEDRGNALAMTGRVTHLPLFEDDGKTLVHLGFAYSLRHPNDPVRYRARPEAHFTERLTNTGFLNADRVHLFGLEGAWVNGPFSLQGEYVGALAQLSRASDSYFQGLYIQASYILTGEHRPYRRSTGYFGHVEPENSVLTLGDWGAWEIAARYSFLDLNESGLPASGRTLNDLTLGVNWYLADNVRIMWNYIHSCVDGSDTEDAADILVMRFQIAF
jgi:phosphate-selective porin OprO and OprP